MIKKYILALLVALSVPVLVASAATPTLNFTGTGSSNTSVQVTGGDINSPVTLYYYHPTLGVYQGYSLGTTNGNGTFSGSVDMNVIANLGANMSMPAYVQVGGYESSRVMWPTMSSSGSVTFSQSSPHIWVGQNGTVTLSGGSGSYYIASNSNASGVTPSISGNTLTLYGAATGSGSIVVCSTGGGCGTLTTTVNSSGSPMLSSSNLTVNSGGQGSVTLSGGAMPYNVSVISGSGVSTTMIGNTLYVNGTATGTQNLIHVCSANSTNCTPLWVNVQAQSGTGTGSGTATTTTGSSMSFTLPLTMGQAVSLNLSGGTGSYYLQSPMSSPALASINGNTLMLNGSAMGSGTVTVCQTGGSPCLPISFTVSQATQPPLTGTGGGWLFSTNLGVGASGQDVVELQTRLRDEGYFNANITGYFGGATKAAVQRYQRALGISATGFVGVQTRAMLNQ